MMLRERQATLLREEEGHHFEAMQKIEAVLKEHRKVESDRRAMVALHHARERRSCERKYRGILSDVTNERGCWGLRTPSALAPRALLPMKAPDAQAEESDVSAAPGGPPPMQLDEEPAEPVVAVVPPEEAKVFWKLDPSENSSRMRLKLKRNPEGTNHAEASPDETAQKAQPDSVEPSPLLKQLVVSKAVSTMQLPQPIADPEWDAVAPGPETPTQAPQDGVERPVHEINCTNVTVSWLTSGTMSVTTTHVYFEAKEVRTHDKAKAPNQGAGVHMRTGRYSLNAPARVPCGRPLVPGAQGPQVQDERDQPRAPAAVPVAAHGAGVLPRRQFQLLLPL